MGRNAIIFHISGTIVDKIKPVKTGFVQLSAALLYLTTLVVQHFNGYSLKTFYESFTKYLVDSRNSSPLSLIYSLSNT